MIGSSATGNRHHERDVVSVDQLLSTARVAAGDHGQRRIEAGRDPRLESAKPLEQVLDRGSLRQRDAQPSRPGGGGEPGSKSHVDLHRVPRVAASAWTL
jgi:hypothetical protein